MSIRHQRDDFPSRHLMPGPLSGFAAHNSISRKQTFAGRVPLINLTAASRLSGRTRRGRPRALRRRKSRLRAGRSFMRSG